MNRKLGIIIEGSDCSGKTTLVNRLRSQLSPQGWYSLSVSHRIANQFDRYLTKYLDDEHIIYDRSHFSEIVYGELWRGHAGFTDWQRQFLNDFVLNNFVVVLAQAPGAVLNKRYKARQQSQSIDVSELEQVQNMFKRDMDDPRIIQYQSIDNASLEHVVNQIIATIGVVGTSEASLKQSQIPSNKKNFILLEGANGSGKSTLAKLLKINMVGWSIKTLDYKETDYFLRYLHAYSLQKETVFDRGHISEVVYSDIFRNGSSFNNQELDSLNQYIAQKGTILFCNPPLTVIKDRVRNATYPKHIREDILGSVVDSFKTFLETHHLPYIEVDTSNYKSVDDAIQHVRTTYSTSTYQDMNWG